MTFWAGVNYWIQFVISVHGGLGTAGGTAVWVLFCLAKGLYLGVFGMLAGVSDSETATRSLRFRLSGSALSGFPVRSSIRG